MFGFGRKTKLKTCETVLGSVQFLKNFQTIEFNWNQPAIAGFLTN